MPVFSRGRISPKLLYFRFHLLCPWIFLFPLRYIRRNETESISVNYICHNAVNSSEKK